MSLGNFEHLSRASLLRELQKLQESERRSRDDSARSDLQQVIHELQIHQVELEMQSREMREAQRLLEVSRSRYADLYDFAPVGYCTLDANGRILEINLTGAMFLGASRHDVIGQRLTSVVSMPTTGALQAHLKKCATSTRTVCTAVSFSVKGRVVSVQMVTTPSPRGAGDFKGYRTAMVDITALTELEQRLRFLSNLGVVLSSTSDYEQVLRVVLQRSVSLFADAGFAHIVSDDRANLRQYSAFADPKKRIPRLASNCH